MKCEECLPLIEQYLDGELGVRTAELVTRHMAVCRSCAALYKRLRREQNFYLRYECDLAAAPAFWVDVQARITQAASARPCHPRLLRGWLAGTCDMFGVPRPRLSFAVVAAVTTIGVTIGMMMYFGARERGFDRSTVSQNAGAAQQSSSPFGSGEQLVAPHNTGESEMNGKTGRNASMRVITPESAGRKGEVRVAPGKENVKRSHRGLEFTGDEPTLDQRVRRAEQKYVAAITVLSRDISRRRSRLDPEAAAQLEQSLAAVDRTIAGTRRAVRAHPNDTRAVQYMLSAYANKVDVLRRVIDY